MGKNSNAYNYFDIYIYVMRTFLIYSVMQCFSVCTGNKFGSRPKRFENVSYVWI